MRKRELEKRLGGGKGMREGGKKKKEREEGNMKVRIEWDAGWEERCWTEG